MKGTNLNDFIASLPQDEQDAIEREYREVRLEALRDRLERSANSGEPIPIKEAFAKIRENHKARVAQSDKEHQETTK